MPKRGENIYKRKDGRWEGRYIYDRTPNGKALYHSIYGKTYADVRQKLLIHREETRKQQLRGCTMTVKALIDCWVGTNCYDIKETSKERYRLLIDKHILPELGTIRVCDLTGEMLTSFVEKKLRSGRLNGKGGLAPKTVNDIYIIIKSALRLASKKYHYNSTELEEVKAPSVKGRKIEVFGKTETKSITNAILNDPSITNLTYLLCLETGLRIGEACAVKWSDFDFLDGIVYVRRTAYRINRGGSTQLIIQAPKSDASERAVPLTAKLLSLLRSARKGMDAEAFILTGSTVKPMDPRTLQYRFRSFLKKLGIKPRGFHTIRHSFATRCVEHGIDTKSLSEILGHASVKTTLQMYVHPSMQSKRSYMEAASTTAA